IVYVPCDCTDYREYEDSDRVVSNISEEKKDKKARVKTEDTKLTYNEEKGLKNIESKLNSLAYDKKELEAKFNNPDLSTDEINKLSQTLQKVIEDIETKEERWLELLAKLEG